MGENQNKGQGYQDQGNKDLGSQKVGKQDLGQGGIDKRFDKGLDQSSGVKGGQAAPKNVPINRDRDTKDLQKDTDVSTGRSGQMDQDLSRDKR